MLVAERHGLVANHFGVGDIGGANNNAESDAKCREDKHRTEDAEFGNCIKRGVEDLRHCCVCSKVACAFRALFRQKRANYITAAKKNKAERCIAHGYSWLTDSGIITCYTNMVHFSPEFG